MNHPAVQGMGMDHQTRCVHYRSPLDVIAIKMKCCGTYYACKDCHDQLAGHPIEVWPRSQWMEKAIMCGQCGTEMTINAYLASNNRCPGCRTHFNPRCANHYHFYFEVAES